MITSRRLRRALASFVVSSAAMLIPPTLPASAATAPCQTSWDVVLQSTPPLHAVDALSPTDVWAVGDGTTTQATTVHWDGSSWTTIDAPVPGGLVAGNSLVGVDAISPTNVWAVGNADNVAKPMIEQWDGTSWHLVASPAPVPNFRFVLLGIRARAANDIWVGGYRYDSVHNGPHHVLIEHWNGSSWQILPTAPLTAPISEIRALAPVTASSVWAVGRRGGPGVNPSLIEHWNGSQWSVVPAPNEGVLGAVAAVTPTNVWAAGTTGFAHWTGSAWVAVNATTYARGLAPVSASDIWSTGPHFTGTSWRPVTTQLSGVKADRYDGVAMGSPTDAWRVGFRGTSGIVEHACPAVVSDAGFSPFHASGWLGATAAWHFDGANVAQHSVTDASGLGLFDSGLRPAGSSFVWTLAWAASFVTTDTTTGRTGVMRAPMLAQPRSGTISTTFVITWASAAPPAGGVLQVQLMRPGAPDFVDWQSGVAMSADFTPDAGTGDYTFRARLMNPSTSAATDWSPLLTVHVS